MSRVPIGLVLSPRGIVLDLFFFFPHPDTNKPPLTNLDQRYTL